MKDIEARPTIGATPLDVKLARGAFLKMLCLAIAFLVLAYFFLASARTTFVQWCAALLAGGLGVQGLATAFAENAADSVLRMDQEGIRHTVLGGVQWRDVVGIAVDRHALGRGSGPFLVLGLAPDAEVQDAWIIPAALNTRGFLRISLRNLDCSPAQVFQHATALRDLVQPSRLKDWQPGMSRDVVAALMARERAIDRTDDHGGAGTSEVSPSEADNRGRTLTASRRALGQAIDRQAAGEHRWGSLLIWAALILSGVGLAVRLLRLLMH